MGRWTEERVLQAAPDQASIAAAQKLARPGPWSETGSNDVLVWGKCQGSGKTPYQVSIDLAAPAYRCSCPSRKFPCKHALALLLMWARGEAAEVRGQAADFAEEWAATRAGRAERSAARGRGEPGQQADPAAQAKRLAARLELMDAGMDDFARWLTDLARTGLAAARTQPYAWWDATAARLVDAQLPGLADQVRAMGAAVHGRADWADHLLLRAGRWWAVTRAWAMREGLSPEELADLRALLGWGTASADIQGTESLPGPWLVLGAHRSDEGRLLEQRTWLRGPDGTVVVVLDVAPQGQALAVPQLAGALLDVAVARYPGSAPRRAMFAGAVRPLGLAPDLGPGTTVAEAFAAEAAAVGLSPWRDRHPVLLAGVRVVPPAEGERGGWVADSSGDALPLADAPLASLLALSGGHPVDMFGELEEGRVRPLSLAVGGVVVTP
ncbi:SWIM zinc finger family protein [Sinomonas mesophila]|uniref:SWIM zinc finger family protein n=1 Tax=Sinomonas mesophila TaxID=1531955 RepID=UPI0009863506|nr:SWIM zinc finger family protein [Sinomonas mesophila]